MTAGGANANPLKVFVDILHKKGERISAKDDIFLGDESTLSEKDDLFTRKGPFFLRMMSLFCSL
jgi:hypothetical protein